MRVTGNAVGTMRWGIHLIPYTFYSMAHFILIYSGTRNIWQTKGGAHEYMGSWSAW